MSDLSRQLARMMWWQGLVIYPAMVLVLAVAAAAASHQVAQSGQDEPVALVAVLAGLAAQILAAGAMLAMLGFWIVTLWHIFRAGQMGFGVWSGLVYTWLAFVLSPWPGVYVIPHMLRLDVKRLLGVEPGKSSEN